MSHSWDAAVGRSCCDYSSGPSSYYSGDSGGGSSSGFGGDVDSRTTSAGGAAIRGPDLSEARAPVGRDHSYEYRGPDSRSAGLEANMREWHRSSGDRRPWLPDHETSYYHPSNPVFSSRRGERVVSDPDSRDLSGWDEAQRTHDAANQITRDAQHHFDNAAHSFQGMRIWEGINQTEAAIEKALAADALHRDANRMENEAGQEMANNGSASQCVIC